MTQYGADFFSFIDVDALIRHSDGSTDVWHRGAALGAGDRIEISVHNETQQTFFVGFATASPASGETVFHLNPVLEPFAVEGGDSETTHIVVRELFGRLDAIALVIGDHELSRDDLAGSMDAAELSDVGIGMLADLVEDPQPVETGFVAEEAAPEGGVEAGQAFGGGGPTPGDIDFEGGDAAAMPGDEEAMPVEDTFSVTRGIPRNGGSGDEARPSEIYAMAGPPGDLPTAEPGEHEGEAETREVHARLDAPESVVVGEEFEVVAGIQGRPQEGVDAEAMTIPRGDVTLEVQLLAFGFDLRDGETWRAQLHATAEEPYPTTTWHLRLPRLEGAGGLRSIEVQYALGGQVIGFAKRNIGAAANASEAAEIEVPPPEPRTFSPPTSEYKADLTITISRPDFAAEGIFELTLESPHAIPKPDGAIVVNLGKEPSAFARLLTQKVEQREGRSELRNTLKGLGREIAERLPNETWEALKALKEKVGGPPRVLIITAEVHVPWELAYLDEPLDSKRPSFMGAQAIVGRWQKVTTDPPPPGLPPESAAVSSFAVVSGEYDKTGTRWSDLKHAKEEAAKLAADYGAERVSATVDLIQELLDRDPPVTLLHFAVHGKAEESGFEEGLIMEDGRAVDAFFVTGSELRGSPFVFLNACQVGKEKELLGDYSGLAAAFLECGASGVVAPLWKIDDEVASQIALRFYERVIKNGESPAGVLHDERARWQETPTTSTFLAYQYWGHPSLRLERETK